MRKSGRAPRADSSWNAVRKPRKSYQEVRQAIIDHQGWRCDICKTLHVNPRTFAKYLRYWPKLKDLMYTFRREHTSEVEKQVYRNAMNGEFKSIAFWLRHNDKRYAPRKALPAEGTGPAQITSVEINLGQDKIREVLAKVKAKQLPPIVLKELPPAESPVVRTDVVVDNRETSDGSESVGSGSDDEPGAEYHGCYI